MSDEELRRRQHARHSIRLVMWAERRGWMWLRALIVRGWWPVWRAWNFHVWPRLEWTWARVSRPRCKIHREMPLTDGFCMMCEFERAMKLERLKP